jgi:hypothetical protein
MTKTRVVFFVLVFVVLVIIGVSLALRNRVTGDLGPRPTSREPLSVRVVVALPVEPFVREAAERFNSEGHTLNGRPIEVSIVPMDGLIALGRWERGEMDPIPTVWIPDSRYLVELVNATLKETYGRDIFLTGGEYRTRPIAISLFCWGIWESRDAVLQAKYGAAPEPVEGGAASTSSADVESGAQPGAEPVEAPPLAPGEITWQAIHDAATAKGGWPELGGQPEWGYFKLVVPNPRRNVGGLMAMVAAAGEYHGKTRIEGADVLDTDFQQWLAELMGAVTDFSSLGSYSVENLALFGYSMGDGGQVLESELLANMQGIQTRWVEPMVIRYPEYVTWFDFPFTIWMGDETNADEKNAALEFERYLLTPEIQQLALAQGLRPANAEVPVDGPDSLFVKWQAQGAVTVVPRTTAMRSPDREVLLALLRWFDLNVYER